MNWKNFFKFTIMKHTENGNQLFFEATLPVSEEFTLQDLMMSRFDHLNLNPEDKKKLSLDMRKIILSHNHFNGEAFQQICKQFKHKLTTTSERELTFSTQGGGLYLFINLMNQSKISGKKITCY